jgi:hypothetical protein
MVARVSLDGLLPWVPLSFPTGRSLPSLDPSAPLAVLARLMDAAVVQVSKPV